MFFFPEGGERKRNLLMGPDFDLLLVSQLQIFTAKCVVLICILYTHAEINRKQGKAESRFTSRNLLNLKDLVTCLATDLGYRMGPFQALHLVSF